MWVFSDRRFLFFIFIFLLLGKVRYKYSRDTVSLYDHFSHSCHMDHIYVRYIFIYCSVPFYMFSFPSSILTLSINTGMVPTCAGNCHAPHQIPFKKKNVYINFYICQHQKYIYPSTFLFHENKMSSNLH